MQTRAPRDIPTPKPIWVDLERPCGVGVGRGVLDEGRLDDGVLDKGVLDKGGLEMVGCAVVVVRVEREGGMVVIA